MKLRASALLWAALTFLGMRPAQSQDLPSQAHVAAGAALFAVPQ